MKKIFILSFFYLSIFLMFVFSAIPKLTQANLNETGFWVAAGQGTNSLAYSTDGINWTGLGTSIFSIEGRGVAWNGTLWVAVGSGTNSIAYSADGINWTGLGTSTFATQGITVAWNGSRFVAGGQGTNNLAYSDDGMTWTGVTGTSIFSSSVQGMGTSGSMWIAAGAGTNTLASSSDGITWTGQGTTTLNSTGIAVGWNGTRWLALGSTTNTIAYSDDGTTWTGEGATVFTVAGRGIGWNGTMWVAAGQGTNSLAYSTDGINWTGNGTATFTTRAFSVASAPAPSLFPARVATYTLTYTTGIGGTLTGTTSQTVNRNEDGSTVTAVPDEGYTFTSWSDGVLTAARTDLDVTSDITVTANFTEIHRTTSGSVAMFRHTYTPSVSEPTTPAVSEVKEPSTPSTTNYTFTRNLKLKDTGEDVKELQKYLNTHGYPVAITGPGSFGNETTKFGLLTRAALIKFQIANNIKPSLGYFGPITRNIINGTN